MSSCIFFALLSFHIILTRTEMLKCENKEDCPEEHSCLEKICKKCLKCDLLFRNGKSCVVDFKDCGKCLPGYEEVLITDFSPVRKPCKPINKKVKLKKCINDSGCPPDTYCNEEFCVNCFNCSLINRLPFYGKCARGLQECGSCMNGFYEVTVTTETNFKPCEKNGVTSEIIEESDSYKISGKNLIFICLVITMLVAIIIVNIQKFKVQTPFKITYKHPVPPSAPPLYTMDAPKFVKKYEEKLVPGLTCVEEKKQQAKVFKQPDALYYYIEEEGNGLNNGSGGNNDFIRSNSWIQDISCNSGERNSARILVHSYTECGVDDSLLDSSAQEPPQVLQPVILNLVDAAQISDNSINETQNSSPVIQNTNGGNI